MAFTQKLITVKFEMANGQFEGGGNVAEVSGLRVSCNVVNAGNGSGQAEIAIWGMPLSVMNQLSTVGTKINQRFENHITVLAGDAESGLSMVYAGDINYAFVDAQAMPGACFRVSSTPSYFAAVKPVTPLSIKGSGDAAQMMKNLADQMGFAFENAGVNVKLSNPYYPGTAWTQALAIAQDGGFGVTIDRRTMVIMAHGKARDGDAVLVSPETGLIAYPLFQEAQVIARVLYNPAVKFWGKVQIKSDLSPACGTWQVNRMDFQLESMMPNGKWEMLLECISL